ncbi:outer membrane beta-barrel protein [Kiritimatiellota bacterium B12222]|nr:outer membrane beta-barrel protein [Kiritimatiellota bacterium B12222]
MKKSTPLRTSLLCTCLMTLSGAAFAQPGSGIRLGEQTLLVPKLDVSYNYNSNVNLRGRSLGIDDEPLDQPESDTYYNYSASLSLSRATANHRLNLVGWYSQDFYQTYKDLDGENYGVGGGYLWTRPNQSTTLALNAQYQHAVDRAGSEDLDLGTNTAGFIENASDRVERDITTADVVLDQNLINNLGSSFIFGYYDTNYLEQGYYDRASYEYIIELNYRLSDKTQPYLRLGYGIDDDQGFEDPAEKPFILGGVRYTATDKLRFDVGIGYETYTRTPLESEELENSNVKYTLSAYYTATAKSTLRLSAHNGYDSVSYDGSSSRLENVAALLYRHQTSRRINQTLLLSWRQDDYLSPILSEGVEYDELKETTRIQYVFNYQTVRPWLNLFANASYEDGQSKIPGDSYDETIVGLGASLRY